MYQRLTFNVKGKYRRETLDGRPHLVVPAAILGEGVIVGSPAIPVYYPGTENARSVTGWNHKPLLVYHPESENSGCSPAVLNTRKVGVILNTNHPDLLRTECWFDEARVQEVDRRVYNAVLGGKGMEVSTGLEFDGIPEEGEFNGTKYKIRATNYRPDHLAVLPDQEGAFSMKMGGGLFANSRGMPEGLTVAAARTVEMALKAVGVQYVNNELSVGDTHRQLHELLASSYGEKGKYWDGYICEIYPDSKTVVFRNTYRQDDPYWMVEYSVEGDVVSLEGKAEKVERVVDFVAVNHAYRLDNGRLVKREVPMAFNKKAHVDSLIAANAGWTEAEREWLMGQPDEKVEKIKVVNAAAPPQNPPPNPAPPPNPSPPQPPPTPTPPPAPGTGAQGQLTWNQVQELMPPHMRQMIDQGQRAFDSEKSQLISVILASPKNRFTKEWLEANKNDLEELRGMAAIATPDTQPGNAPMFQNAGGAPLYFGAQGAVPGYAANQAADGPPKVVQPPVYPTFTSPLSGKN